jgi:chromosome segregation ATPase
MEKKKNDESMFPRFFCNFEKVDIDQVDQSLEDALLQRNDFAKEFLDLDLKYQEAEIQNKKMRQLISQLNADKKVLQTQNGILNKHINFLEKHHDLQIQELKTQLKHQQERQKYPTVKSPST